MPIRGAFGHGGQHDVHDADATHNQADAGNRAKHNIENAFGLFGLAQ